MTKIRITKRDVDAATPRSSRYTVFDSGVAGFGLRIFPSGAKSWLLEYRAGEGGRSAQKRRFTIGHATDLTPDQARREADKPKARVETGSDPQGSSVAQRAAPTVEEIAAAFIDMHMTKRAATTRVEYGPGDNFDLSTSHVLPALLCKAHEAKLSGDKEIEIWGTDRPRREFLYVDDCADALVFLLETYSEYEHINVGSGEVLSILELTRLICEVVGFDGDIVHDLSKPDETPRKLMRADKLKARGWTPRIDMRGGVQRTYEWYIANAAERRYANAS